MIKMTDEEMLHLLHVFADAWNHHDLDTLMACMTDDCVFEASAGSDVCGTRSVGQQEVRAAFSECLPPFLMLSGAVPAISQTEIVEFQNGRLQVRARMERALK